MGVPRLFSFLRTSYPGIFSRQVVPLDEIYLDGNALLYPIAEESKVPEVIARLLLQVANEYAIAFSCPCSIYIDGAAHMGKIKQQRARRFLYDVPTFITTTPASVGQRRDVVDVQRDDTGNLHEWTPAMFSPGTEMMRKIHEYIEAHLSEYNIRTYSSYLEPGEGEHKIIRDIKIQSGRTGTQATPRRVGIVGKDADLLLLAMAITVPERWNVSGYIIRHDDAQKMNGYRPSDPLYVIDTTSLRNGIVSSMGLESIWDFILATFLVGNDFLPPVPETEDLRTVIPIFSEIFADKTQGAIVLYEDGEISWQGFGAFIDELAKKLPVNRGWIQTERPREIPPAVYDTLYYPNMSPFAVDTGKIVLAWMTTVEWIFRYYHDGLEAASRDWQYPPTFAPTLYTLSNSPHLDDSCTHEALRNRVSMQVPPLTPVQALGAMLPIWLHSLLPEDVRRKLRDLRQYYPYAFLLQNPTQEPIIPVIPYSVAASL